MKNKLKIVVEVEAKFSFWTAFKLRFAGITFMKTYLEKCLEKNNNVLDITYNESNTETEIINKEKLI